MLNLNCTICAELFGQADDVHVTVCGHMFHYVCLVAWLERSKTCPQCRSKCNQRNIFRVYFNLANLDISQVDIGSLQEQLDDLKLQLQMKEKESQKAEAQLKTLKEAQKKCMKTICALETKLAKKDVIINSYTETVNVLKADVRITEDLRNEVKNLRLRLDTVEGVSSILTASNADAEKMLKNESDPRKLGVWLATLKRELVNCENKKTDMRNVLRVVQNDLRREIEDKKKLQERISQLESECYQFHNELESLKRPIAGGSKTPSNRVLANSEISFQSAALQAVKKEEKRLTISPTTKENVRKIEESDSPYLNIKSSSVGFMPYNFKRKADVNSGTNEIGSKLTIVGPSKLTTLKISPKKHLTSSLPTGAIRKTSSDITEKYSIFKKPRLGLAPTAAGTVFNGFGGSEKIDPFAHNGLDDDIEIIEENKAQSKLVKKTHTNLSSTSLSDRLKSGGLRNFMVQKTQKK